MEENMEKKMCKYEDKKVISFSAKDCADVKDLQIGDSVVIECKGIVCEVEEKQEEGKIKNKCEIEVINTRIMKNPAIKKIENAQSISDLDSAEKEF